MLRKSILLFSRCIIPNLFSQKYWHVVGNDITQAVIDYIHSRKLLKNINFTHLTLILKTNSPEFLSQYRPISFCNVLYKIVSKVLAKRLKSILPSIISESQNAFFWGCLIIDNVLVTFESLHYMKTKR